jgi:hypothetical protein
MNVEIRSKVGGPVPGLAEWAAGTGNDAWKTMAEAHAAALSADPAYKAAQGNAAFDAMVEAFLNANNLEIIVTE